MAVKMSVREKRSTFPTDSEQTKMAMYTCSIIERVNSFVPGGRLHDGQSQWHKKRNTSRENVGGR